MQPRVIFNAALTGTQFAPGSAGVNLERCGDFGFSIEHPAGTTTTYTVQGSNLTETAAKGGVDDDWFDYLEVTPLVLAAAAKDYMEVTDFPFARARLKAVTTVGNGAAKVRLAGKRRSA